MTAPALVVSTPAVRDRLATPTQAATLSSPHLVRVVGQLAVLAAVLAAGTGTSMASVVLVAQLAVGLATYLVHRTSASVGTAVARTVRAWGVGAVAGALAAVVVGAGVRSQVWAVVVALGLLVLGRAYSSYRAAGDRIDAVLATLPPTADGSDRVSSAGSVR